VVSVTVIRREVEIRGARERVWDYVVDFERMHEWFYGVNKVALLTTHLGVGTERIMTLLTRQSFLERFVAWEPHRSFSFYVVNPPVFVKDWADTVNVETASDGVLLTWETRYTPAFGIAGRLLDACVIAPLVNAAFVLSLKRFKSIIEGQRGYKKPV
jgi:hypothetical protein